VSAAPDGANRQSHFGQQTTTTKTKGKTMTLIETFLNLMVIGWLLFLGFFLGKALEEYIEDRAKKAAKRELQNKEGGSK
jgi:competence protein ComGC